MKQLHINTGRQYGNEGQLITIAIDPRAFGSDDASHRVAHFTDWTRMIHGTVVPVLFDDEPGDREIALAVLAEYDAGRYDWTKDSAALAPSVIEAIEDCVGPEMFTPIDLLPR